MAQAQSAAHVGAAIAAASFAGLGSCDPALTDVAWPPSPSAQPVLPPSRGPLSEQMRVMLLSDPGQRMRPLSSPPCATRASEDVLGDEDFQLALTMCYELHYRGFCDVDEAWEWDGQLLDFRATLEQAFLGSLHAAVSPVVLSGPSPRSVLQQLIETDSSPSLSTYLLREATVAQFREFVSQRSLYHLKEADPHTWAIPRLGGRAKAALVEIQADEYGGGRVERMHASLFATTMTALGLDARVGAYLPDASAAMLATLNLMSLFGLHRRWRGAVVGHLAVLEMTSTTPNRRYGGGLRRLGFGPAATAFYDEHVHADALHEQIASVDLCEALAKEEPRLLGDVYWGAACCLELEGRFATSLLTAWQGSVDRTPAVSVQ